MNRIAMIIYLVVGFIVAADRNYLENLDRIKRLASAVLAVLLWPLLLLGIDLRIN